LWHVWPLQQKLRHSQLLLLEQPWTCSKVCQQQLGKGGGGRRRKGGGGKTRGGLRAVDCPPRRPDRLLKTFQGEITTARRGKRARVVGGDNRFAWGFRRRVLGRGGSAESSDDEVYPPLRPETRCYGSTVWHAKLDAPAWLPNTCSSSWSAIHGCRMGLLTESAAARARKGRPTTGPRVTFPQG
jgi:hypothetical protein